MTKIANNDKNDNDGDDEDDDDDKFGDDHDNDDIDDDCDKTITMTTMMTTMTLSVTVTMSDAWWRQRWISIQQTDDISRWTKIDVPLSRFLSIFVASDHDTIRSTV